MKRERIDIRPGDLIRCPDRATARWRAVLRVGRRRDGTRYVTIRRSRFWRALGLSVDQRIEWSVLRAFGYGLKRASSAEPKPLREAIQGLIDPTPDSRPYCPYCGTNDHLAGSPASDRCRERAVAAPDEATS